MRSSLRSCTGRAGSSRAYTVVRRRFGRPSTCVAVAAAVALTLVPAAPAQPQQGDIDNQLIQVASGLTAPVMATNANDGTGRLFIVTQVGKRWILHNGTLLPTPFLDITSEIPTLATSFDERGLLGLAFHPDYPTNGRCFVRYSKPRPGMAGEPCFGTSRGCHEEVLAEFSVSSDPNLANPTATILFRVDEPQFNHNGAHVTFGPDGYLYFSLGDGGGAHDGLADTPPSHGPIGNGQNIDATLGKVLRIHVDSGSPYAIPPDNPFASTTGLDEIYAYGFRNPYRFCFDDGPDGDGRLIVADVGQNLFEEVDVVELGGNYGWVLKEGFHCFDPFNPASPPATCSSTGAMGEPLLDPVAEYSHTTGISITGGHVYRGSQFPALVGKYDFGDWSQSFPTPSGQRFYLDADGDMSQIFKFCLGMTNAPLGLRVMGFGKDEAGELYLCTAVSAGPTGTGGAVHRITYRCPGDTNGDRMVDNTDLQAILDAWASMSGDPNRSQSRRSSMHRSSREHYKA
jgi:glucose/arabinose dehydrogenase